MKRYRIVKVETNLGKIYYRIDLRVRLFWGLISYWQTDDYEDSYEPVEYGSLEEAKEMVNRYAKNLEWRLEHPISEQIIEVQ